MNVRERERERALLHSFRTALATLLALCFYWFRQVLVQVAGEVPKGFARPRLSRLWCRGAPTRAQDLGWIRLDGLGLLGKVSRSVLECAGWSECSGTRSGIGVLGDLGLGTLQCFSHFRYIQVTEQKRALAAQSLLLQRVSKRCQSRRTLQ